MPQYAPISGTILQIDYPEITSTQDSCGFRIALQSMNQGIVNFMRALFPLCFFNKAMVPFLL